MWVMNAFAHTCIVHTLFPYSAGAQSLGLAHAAASRARPVSAADPASGTPWSIVFAFPFSFPFLSSLL